MNARVVRLLQRSSDRLQKNQKQQLYQQQQQQQQHSDGGDSSDREPPKAPRRKRRDCAAGVKAKLETESNNALACLRSLPLSPTLLCSLFLSLLRAAFGSFPFQRFLRIPLFTFFRTGCLCLCRCLGLCRYASSELRCLRRCPRRQRCMRKRREF